jgi:hypothetical protein
MNVRLEGFSFFIALCFFYFTCWNGNCKNFTWNWINIDIEVDVDVDVDVVLILLSYYLLNEFRACI